MAVGMTVMHRPTKWSAFVPVTVIDLRKWTPGRDWDRRRTNVLIDDEIKSVYGYVADWATGVLVTDKNRSANIASPSTLFSIEDAEKIEKDKKDRQKEQDESRKRDDEKSGQRSRRLQALGVSTVPNQNTVDALLDIIDELKGKEG